ncbi:MAG: type IV toxin-antitoxin system AbiEi family antitoxin domain-containing protein [Hespellia sp.]|nr:type IV toxin-antitoxin system AbiEi family antitoxin domain-containing protein [Hespellia sp.]
MRENTYKKLDNLKNSNNGYVDTAALIELGYTNRQILALVKEGRLEKVSYGYYWVVDSRYQKPYDYKAVEVGLVNPGAVICGMSACYFHGLIPNEPKELSVATKRSDRHKIQMNFEVKRYFFSDHLFEEGVSVIKTMQGNYRIYDAERSVCDCIRLKKNISEESFYVLIENYKKQTDTDITRLWKYAELLRSDKQIEKILK